MGTSLNGLTPAGTYPGLIKTGDNAPIDGTLKTLSDGNGNNLPMSVSTTTINLTGTAQVGGVAIANTTQVAAKQDTLVSGTNIKTINGTSLLGSGNIPVVTSPSGVAGAIQFSNGSAFASDAANLFWDDTNNRLGVGTNNPYAATFQVKGGGADITTNAVFVENSVGLPAFIIRNNGTVNLPGNLFAEADITVGSGSSLGARLGIKGSGSTSATTSLLVQNSSGTDLIRVNDLGILQFGGTTSSFPAIKRNGSELEAKYADDSLFCNFQAAVGRFTGFNTSAFTNNFALGSNCNIKQKVVVEDGGPTAITASAILEIKSTTLGFLPPVMTTTQKNAIATPAAGLVVYDSTTNKLCCYNGSTWNDLF